MSTFTTSDGLSLYFEDTGEGLPVLCLPGLTRTTRDFDYVAPHLSDIRLITLDYRGRGKSDWDPSWQNYALPVEGRDVLELLAHLGLSKTAILGTSRGGLNAMGLATVTPDALLGVALNDIGPEIDAAGMAFIMTYLGINPVAKSHAELAATLAHVMTGFPNVPAGRWLAEAQTHYIATSDGLTITYDPNLRKAVQAIEDQPTPDLWPFFDAIPDRPFALIWGENSDLLKEPTVQEMQRRRPDMLLARVADRGHIPFLDEPESLTTLRAWIEAMK
ncbi:MAG: alpha/beta fold hydrolase [Paracoccaceae bacterium]